jgi:hypothetical protein
MKELNPEIAQDRLDKIASHLNNFESRFDSFIRRFMIDFPVEELVNNVLHKSQKVSKNVMGDDLVELLAGVFAVWTILKSKKMFQETKDPGCILRPHPIQLIAIFRLLNLDSPTNMWKYFTSMIGAGGSHSMPGHLIQVIVVIYDNILFGLMLKQLGRNW